MTTSLTTSQRARLGRYALWQLRDFARDKGVATLFVGGLALFLAYLSARAQAHMNASDVRALPIELHQRILSELLGTFVIVGVLFATNGIVSDDRKHGYYKFFFAKPVSVPRFYAQKFAVNGAGFVLAGVLVLAIFAALFRPLFVPEVPLVLVAAFIALGGVGFLLSTIWRLDWLSLMLVYVVAEVMWSIFGNRAGVKPLLYILPPVQKLSGLYRAAVFETGLPWGDIAWLTGYGLVCFLLALVVLRRREIAAE